MLRTEDRKLIRYRSPRSDPSTDRTPAIRMFDLRADPGESNDLTESRRERVRALRRRLEPWEQENLRLRTRYGARAVKADGATAAELKQLGY